MRGLVTRVLLLTCCLPALRGEAQRLLPPADCAAVDRAVEAERDRQGVVGVAIGVLQRGRVVYAKGYGLADRETDRPVTTATVFNWASNSKPVLAIAAMQLVELGELDLDSDIRAYVPEFAGGGGSLTMRHLLCHQSGIPHYSNGRIVPGADPTTAGLDPCHSSIAAIARFSRSPLLFLPGDRVSYSSYAYVLASAVVARAGDARLEEQIQKRIVTPLSLSSFQCDRESTGQRDWATGYVRREDGTVVPTPDYAHCWKHGAGGFKSNIVDFARWAEGLLRHELVSRRIERQAWTRQETNDGALTDWGLGFTVSDQNGLKVSHNGSQDEARTRLVLYPNARHGVVVMSNCRFADPRRLSTAIYSALR